MSGTDLPIPATPARPAGSTTVDRTRRGAVDDLASTAPTGDADRSAVVGVKGDGLLAQCVKRDVDTALLVVQDTVAS